MHNVKKKTYDVRKSYFIVTIQPEEVAYVSMLPSLGYMKHVFCDAVEEKLQSMVSTHVVSLRFQLQEVLLF